MRNGKEIRSIDRWRLLVGLICRRAPELFKMAHKARDHVLTADECEALVQVVLDEFCEFGLRPDSEPNEYGLLLEDLVDDVSEMRESD